MNKIAVAWLSRDDWPEWQRIDSQLPAYEIWLRKIETAIAAASSQGQTPVKVAVAPAAFDAWCREHGKPIHRSTRAEYAAAMLLGQIEARADPLRH